MQALFLAITTLVVCQEPTAESKLSAAAQFPAEWVKLQRLAGGEWKQESEDDLGRFHRFRLGPGKRSLWAHTRDASKLAEWPKSEAVYYWHPGQKITKGIAVGDSGTLFDGELHWMDQTMQVDFAYYLPERDPLSFVSRWEFSGNQSYQWSLFSKSSAGLTQTGSMRFVHAAQPRPLPEIAPPIFQPSARLKFLDHLTGSWELSSKKNVPSKEKSARKKGKKAPSSASVTFRWAAGGEALLIHQMPAEGSKIPAAEGMVFWHPKQTKVRYLLVDERGAVTEGKLEPVEDVVSFQATRFDGEVQSTFQERWIGDESSGIRLEREHAASETGKAMAPRVLTRPH